VLPEPPGGAKSGGSGQVKVAGDGDTPHPPATQSPAIRNIVSSFARRKKHRQAKADKIRTGSNPVSDQSRIGVLLL